MTTSSPLVLPLNTPDASLDIVGGKGRSLATLASADFPVPTGFLISTNAYQKFVEANGIQESIVRFAADATIHQAASVELAASKIQGLFETASLPTEIATAIRQAYAELGNEPSVAVRSSATAEDLPGLSFAGQQDTFLHVRGPDRLLEAVVRCWASLWTARAIGYRHQLDIDHNTLKMGVVVQAMVDADVSGILFTANPATGDRAEIVVNASFGLGEAVVGGQVTPDTYLLDRENLTPKQTVIGTKKEMTVAAGEQGTKTQSVPESNRQRSSLSPDVLSKLATLSLQAETLFGGRPQDIEWAVADGRCWLLQSRPITNLPSPPLGDVSWEPPSPSARLVRRQVVENMPQPLSPLFEELYLSKGLDQAMDRFTRVLGLTFDLGEFATRPLFVTVNGYGYCRYDIHFSWRSLRLIPEILYWYVRSLRKLLRNVIPLWRDEGLPAYLATIDQWNSVKLDEATDEQLMAGVRALAVADASYWFYITMVVGAAKVTEGILNRFLSSRAVKKKLTSGMFLSGFPSKTLQAQEDLRIIAAAICAIESVRTLVLTVRPEELIESLEREPAASEIVADIARHLEKYGHQIYNLDFVEPTQGEDPLPVLLSLTSLVRNTDTPIPRPARQAAMARERESLTMETMVFLGPLRRRLFRKFLAWAQKFGPYREDALFYMGAAWPTLRRMALELGGRLVKAGTLASADGVFYLETAELAEACAARRNHLPRADLKKTAEDRQTLREARKRLHPPGRVPADLRFKVGPIDFTRFLEVWETQKRNANDAHTLRGFAVSPGTVTGTASVILSAADFGKMKPGTILVCPTTTPAWTPLFAQASGLVTDIGAILAHGSIVAREYGIPAVLGTGNVTERIASGQLIAVDGNAGTVTIIE